MYSKKIYARTVYDSRGNPTIEVEITTDNGIFSAIVPSGASTGIHEAMELRDKDKTRWGGKGVLNAIRNVNEIIGPQLIKEKIDVRNQEEVDKYLIKLDNTKNKSRLGANATLGVSLAIAKAGAAANGVPLYEHVADLTNLKKKNFFIPVPYQNVLNGGSHAGGKLAFQELMIVPLDSTTFSESMRMCSEVYHCLHDNVKKKYGPSAANVGDEGGVAPDISSIQEALEIVTEAINSAGYTGRIKIAIDSASSEFYKNKKYDLDFKNPNSDPSKWLTGTQLCSLYGEIIEKYPIISIEDPFAEDDWESWSCFYKKFHEKIQIVGDDLTVTNTERMKIAIEKKTANCLLLKINQVGTLTEAFDAAKLAYENGWKVMISHRSGESEDVSIAEIAVGLGSCQIKSGAPTRSERLCKYNQLLRIEERLGNKAIYPGKKILS